MTRTQSRREIRSLAKQLGVQTGDLLERVAKVRGTRVDYSEYARDPEAFFVDILHVTDPPLTEDQKAIIWAIFEHDFVAVVSAQGVGKTFVIAGYLWFAVMVQHATVIATATTTRHVKHVIFRQNLRRFFLEAKFPGSLFEMAYRGPGEGTILGLVPGDIDKLTGTHAANLLIWVDEMQGAQEFVLEGAMACLTGSENNRLVLAGNPIHAGGDFEAVTRNPDCHTIQISGLTHPNVVTGEELYGGAITRGFISRLKRQFGGDKSPQYVSRVLGRFPTSTDEYSLITDVSWLERAHELWESLGKPRDGRWLFTHDPARGGSSASLTGVWKGNVLIRLVSWRTPDTMASCGKLQKLFVTRGEGDWEEAAALHGYLHGNGSRQSYDVVVDEPGLGAAVLDRLRELRYQVIGFQGGSVALDPRFNNRRTECFWALRNDLEAGTVALPRDRELDEELLALKWHEDSSGRTCLETKDKLVKRLGRSPDRADAAALRYVTQNVCTGRMSDVNW